MEKVEFIDKAPVYYALAIATSLAQAKGAAKTIGQLDDIFNPTETSLEKPILVTAAIQLLDTAGVLEVIPDDFGPSLYKATPTLAEWLTAEGPDRFPLFRKYKEVGSKLWLRDAIDAVNFQFNQLKIKDEDFEQADYQWEPIPLDRKEESLKQATKEIDKAIKAIEGDNGYSVHAPREREYVLSSLKKVSETLKQQGQIYLAELNLCT